MSYNGGFPPLKLCASELVNVKTDKERFFANVPKQNINIRQILKETKKPFIEIEEETIDELEIV